MRTCGSLLGLSRSVYPERVHLKCLIRLDPYSATFLSSRLSVSFAGGRLRSSCWMLTQGFFFDLYFVADLEGRGPIKLLRKQQPLLIIYLHHQAMAPASARKIKEKSEVQSSSDMSMP